MSEHPIQRARREHGPATVKALGYDADREIAEATENELTDGLPERQLGDDEYRELEGFGEDGVPV